MFIIMIFIIIIIIELLLIIIIIIIIIIMVFKIIDIFILIKYWRKFKIVLSLIKYGLNVVWDVLKKMFLLDIDVKN